METPNTVFTALHKEPFPALTSLYVFRLAAHLCGQAFYS